MLHIVQTVFAGAAEAPQVFLDQAAAEAAFVEQVKACWRQSYPAYCERSGVGIDAFASAKEFLETLDLSEKGRIHYWVLTPADAGPDAMKDLEGLGRWAQQGEKSSAAVREKLAGVLGELVRLLAELGVLAAPVAAAQADGPEGAAVPAPVAAEKTERDAAAEKYATKEWKNFVGTLMSLAGGGRSDFPPLPRADWRQAVYSDETSLEYWDWVAVTVDRYREAAEKAGYAVIEDPASPGHYRVRSPGGAAEETSFYSLWEAWCHAGKQLS